MSTESFVSSCGLHLKAFGELRLKCFCAFYLFNPTAIFVWEMRPEREGKQWRLNLEAAAYLIVTGMGRAWVAVFEVKGPT